MRSRSSSPRALVSSPGARRPSNGNRARRLRRSASTASAMPGYWTLTATATPSRVVARCTCPIEAAAIASGSMSARTADTGSPHSAAISFSIFGHATVGAASRSSARRRWMRSPASASMPGNSTVEMTWPIFIAAPFILPSCTTSCSTTSAVRAAWARSRASSDRTRSSARPPARRPPCTATSPPSRLVRRRREEIGVPSLTPSPPVVRRRPPSPIAFREMLAPMQASSGRQAGAAARSDAP